MKSAIYALCVLGLLGCVRAAPSLPTEQRVAQTPRKGEITLASKAAEPVGQVVPIDVNVANGTMPASGSTQLRYLRSSGRAGSGAIVGGALGAGVGGVGGAAAAGEEASRSAASQISVLALQDRWIEPRYSINGYVFYPAGTYKGTEALVKGEEGEIETLRAGLQ